MNIQLNNHELNDMARIFIEKLIEKISGKNFTILSTRHIYSHNDLDLFVIINDNDMPIYDSTSFFIELINIFRELIEEIYTEYNICIYTFTTLRVKEFLNTINCNKSSFSIPLHLLVYLSPEYMISWEPLSLIESLISEHIILTGNKNMVNILQNKINAGKKYVFNENIDYLLNILYNVYIDWFTSINITERILLKYYINKTIYALRFILWELLCIIKGRIINTNRDIILETSMKEAKLRALAKNYNEYINLSYVLEADKTIDINELAKLSKNTLFEVSKVLGDYFGK